MEQLHHHHNNNNNSPTAKLETLYSVRYEMMKNNVTNNNDEIATPKMFMRERKVVERKDTSEETEKSFIQRDKRTPIKTRRRSSLHIKEVPYVFLRNPNDKRNARQKKDKTPIFRKKKMQLSTKLQGQMVSRETYRQPTQNVLLPPPPPPTPPPPPPPSLPSTTTTTTTQPLEKQKYDYASNILDYESLADFQDKYVNDMADTITTYDQLQCLYSQGLKPSLADALIVDDTKRDKEGIDDYFNASSRNERQQSLYEKTLSPERNGIQEDGQKSQTIKRINLFKANDPSPMKLFHFSREKEFIAGREDLKKRNIQRRTKDQNNMQESILRYSNNVATRKSDMNKNKSLSEFIGITLPKELPASLITSTDDGKLPKRLKQLIINVNPYNNIPRDMTKLLNNRFKESGSKNLESLEDIDHRRLHNDKDVNKILTSRLSTKTMFSIRNDDAQNRLSSSFQLKSRFNNILGGDNDEYKLKLEKSKIKKKRSSRVIFQETATKNSIATRRKLNARKTIEFNLHSARKSRRQEQYLMDGSDVLGQNVASNQTSHLSLAGWVKLQLALKRWARRAGISRSLHFSQTGDQFAANRDSTLTGHTRISFLKSIELFKNLEDMKLHKIANNMSHRSYITSEVIIKENEIGNEFFIIESGSVDVFVLTKASDFLTREDKEGIT